jgi:TonB family protein
MPSVPPSRARGHLGRGALLSLLLHVQVIAPLAIAAIIYGGREEAQRAEEVDVGFEDISPEDLPKDLPSIDAPQDVLEPLKPDAKKPKVAEQKKKEPAKPDDKPPEKAKPEPEIVAPPPPQAEAPPPQPQRAHEKLVEINDPEHEAKPPDDAKFLAEKNHKVAEETRARETNLEADGRGKNEASAPSENQDPEIGGEKERIRQLQDRESLAGRQAPNVTPHQKPELASPEKERSKSLLALRDPAPRAHEITPETADPSLPRAADGFVRAPSPARGADARADRANGKKVKLSLAGRDYEYLFGESAAADRKISQTLASMRKGRFQKRQSQVRSALENFIPEVKPGNQTALNTREAPFAAFVARMHRSIHMLWGFGVIEDWDELSGTSPFNNRNLATTLEMVLNADGTVDKVTVVKSSGYLPYDAAAIDVAYTAAPYPDPPKAIRSANGKIYLHWRFFRDDRQCATSGVDPFILDNPSDGSDGAGASAMDGQGAGPKVPRAPTATPREGPRQLRRDLDDDAHRAKVRALDEEVARAQERPGSNPAEEEEDPHAGHAHAAPAVAEAGNAAARAVATRWFSALGSADVATLSSVADVPFRASQGIQVRSRDELKAMLKDLSGEIGRLAAGDVRLYSAAGLRAALGRMPQGLDDGSGLLFAAAPLADGDTLVAALARRGQSYRVVGLARR